MLGGSYYYNADRLKRKEYTDLVKKRQAQEKKEAWIRELEARDQEDKDWRLKMGKVRDAKREEAEREALNEKHNKEMKSEDGKGVIAAVKEKVKDAKELESIRQTAEQGSDAAAIARQKRRENEMKQEKERSKQAEIKEAAGMGPDRRIWGESGGGLFGWRRLQNLWNKPQDGDSAKDD